MDISVSAGAKTSPFEYIIVSRLEGVTRDYLKYADIEKSLGGKRIVLTQVDDASNDLSTFFSKFKELGDEILRFDTATLSIAGSARTRAATDLIRLD